MVKFEILLSFLPLWYFFMSRHKVGCVHSPSHQQQHNTTALNGDEWTEKKFLAEEMETESLQLHTDDEWEIKLSSNNDFQGARERERVNYRFENIEGSPDSNFFTIVEKIDDRNGWMDDWLLGYEKEISMQAFR